MLAYDLDDTLAETSFEHIMGQGSLVDMMANAPVKYQPEGDFVIITARGENAAVQRTTRKWVADNLTGCKEVYFTTGSGRPGMERKLSIIKEHGYDGYVDSSGSNLAIMATLDDTIELYDIEHGQMQRIQ